MFGDSFPFPVSSARIAHDVGQFGRPCEIVAHQEYYTGLLHRFIEHEGKAMAVVEDHRGKVSLVDAYKVRFTDREV